MAIIKNISDEFGDVLLIKANIPIIGLIALTDFIDDTTEQGNNRFYKEFRYTIDGINYTNWQELTVTNLNAVVIDSRDTFIIEYRYTHINDESASFSISGSLDLAWNSTQLDGQFLEVPCGKTYEQSIFADFFSCHATEVLAWCVNVTEKLYKQGIVPKFVTRGDESNINGIDRDYIDFWRAVACFFAYIVVFARQFEKFRENDQLLSQFLEQRGVFFCDDASSADKNYLVEYYFDEIRQRGTSQIYKTKDQRNSEVDGELLRLLCYNKEVDEFIFNVHLPHTIGWSVENSSPLYTGLSRQTGAIKGYEFTKDFVDLAKYPIFGNGVIEIIEDNGDQVLSIKDVPIGEISGIGENNLNYKIVVDDDMSYEITFFVRQVDAGENLTFGVRTYDIASNSISPVRIDTDVNQSFFFEKIQLNKTDKYYLIRGIIYSKDTNASDVENNLAIGQGKHLKFASGTYGLIPYIAVDKDDDQSISISQAVGWNQLNANIITDGDNGTFEAEKETYQLLNANIFTDATNGTFEDIEANWISPKDDGVHWVERSSTYAYAGSFSCRASGFFSEIATFSVVDSFNKEQTALNISLKPSLVSGRRYILRAKIRTEQNAWPNRNGETLYFNFYTGSGYPVADAVRQYRTHDQIEDSWQEISLQFTATATDSTRPFPIKAFWNSTTGENLLKDGEIYVDNVVIEEYEAADNWGDIKDSIFGSNVAYLIERSSNFQYQGSYSGRAYSFNATSATGSYLNGTYTRIDTLMGVWNIDCIAGRRYTMSAYIYTDGDSWPNRSGNQIDIGINLTNISIADDLTYVLKSNYDINGRWSKISIDFVANSTASTQCSLRAFMNGASNWATDGEIYIDQLQCAEFEFIGDESQTISTGNEIRIWDLKVRPLNTPYSTGFVLPKNFISIWAKKRNGQLSERQFEQRLRKYLLPYNSTFKVNYLEVESGDALGDYSANDYSDDYFI